jgi:hypothetical protein
MSAEDEIDLVEAMYGDLFTRVTKPGAVLEFDLALTASFVITARAHSTDYPEQQRPTVAVVSGPNAALIRRLEQRLRAFVDEQPLGEMMIVALATEAVAAAEAEAAAAAAVVDDRRVAEEEHAARRRAEEEAAMDNAEDEERLLTAHQIYRGDAISDRGSKFVAHVVRVTTVAEVQAVIAVLLTRRRIAVAAHPAIYAYRFEGDGGVVHQDSEDDGEHGAARVVAFLMEQMKVMGYVVVVTRWYGGIHLGPDRFKHIAAVARDALVASGAGA